MLMSLMLLNNENYWYKLRNNNVDTTKINHVSLCSGYGGIDLGLRSVLPTVRTIAYVEIEAFACANLVEKMESKQLDEAPIWTNLKTFDARPFSGQVDILSGGFPCQPFSHAGQQKSTDDPRHLFPDIERIILECEPRIIFLENVEGIISSKLGGEPDTSVLKHVLERLEALGYRATASIFSAEEVGAPHRRKRVFIAGVRELPNNDSERLVRESESNSKEETLEEQRWGDTDGQGAEELANTHRDSCRQRKPRRAVGELRQESEGLQGGESEGKTRQEFRGGGTEGRGINMGNTTSDGFDKGKSDKEARRIDRCCETGGVQESAGGCSELGDTQHDGSLAKSKLRGDEEASDCGRTEKSGTPKQSSGADRSADVSSVSGCEGGEQSGELADTNNCGGGEDWMPAKLRTGGSIESSRDGGECCPRENDQEREGMFPSRPGEPQQWWEAPRTIGEDEEVITPVGLPDDAGFGVPADLVHSSRIDSLRLLGNGVVPATASKAFVVLMDKLNES
jgi:DNA-cytosine methyltransferase